MNAPAAALAEKPKHTLHLTRAALYILEGILQDPSPCDTKLKTQRWNKAWVKVRKSNDRVLKLSWGDCDLEKPSLRKEGESDIAWTNRRAEWDVASKAWEDLPVTFVITDKTRDTCREAIDWAYEHKADGKSKVQLNNSTHTELLLVQLGLLDPVADDE